LSKILVVDDDPGILRLLEYILTKEEYQVLTASNGIEGLRRAQEEAPDLVILDVMLPGLDGFEVCHRLRSGPRTAELPVIMLSAKGQAIDRDTGVKTGADEYLVKPVNRVELLNTVQGMLARLEEAHQTRARVIAFTGSKGGVGASTVAASISVVLSQMGYSTIMVDLCSSSGVLPALMGLNAQHNIAELFNTPRGSFSRDDLETVLSLHHTGVRLLSGEQTPEEYGKVTPAGIEALLQDLSAMADYILIDLPSSPSEVVGAALSRCDFVNLVTTPGPKSLTRTNSAISLLSNMKIDPSRIGVVIVDRTGAGLNDELSTLTAINEFPVMGKIPFDATECADAEERGNPLAIAAPLSPAAVALRALVEKLLKLEQLAPSSKKDNNGSRGGD